MLSEAQLEEDCPLDADGSSVGVPSSRISSMRSISSLLTLSLGAQVLMCLTLDSGDSRGEISIPSSVTLITLPLLSSFRDSCSAAPVSFSLPLYDGSIVAEISCSTQTTHRTMPRWLINGTPQSGHLWDVASYPCSILFASFFAALALLNVGKVTAISTPRLARLAFDHSTMVLPVF